MVWKCKEGPQINQRGCADKRNNDQKGRTFTYLHLINKKTQETEPCSSGVEM